MKIHFFDVGQGDSILLEWRWDGEDHFGIIDCNIYKEQNPLVKYLEKRDIKSLEFIVLSHFHYDHFSGFPDVFKYCIDKNIKINWFLHTNIVEMLEYYTNIDPTQEFKKKAKEFFHYFDLICDKYIQSVDTITYKLRSLKIDDQTTLQFIAPSGLDYIKFAKAVGLYRKKQTKTIPDLNKLGTIITISKENRCIILTSDAVSNSFKKNRNRIQKEVQLIQVPHHFPA